MNANPVGPAAAPRIPNNAFLHGVLGKLSLTDMRNAPSFTRCQLGRTPGTHERRTHGHAIGVAHDVMKDALKNVSGKDAAALNRTLQLLSPDTCDNLGPVLLVHLTAIGAVREGVASLLRASPGDEKLVKHLKQLDDAIIKTGIKTGKCKRTEPDAVYLAFCPSTEKVCDAVAAGKRVMVECAAKIGGQELLAGVARAILPEAMTNSLTERLPNLVGKFQQAEGAPEWGEVLQAQAARHLDQVLKALLESGGTEDLQTAVLQLLKTPEYILQSQRGSAGDEPDAPQRSNAPPEPPAWVQQKMRDGAPINYNVVKNDFSDLIKLLDKPPLQLSDLRNLLNDAREDAFERGRLTEIVRNQDEYIDKLERRLLETQERLEKFANGNGQTRVPQGDRIQVDVEDKATSTDDLISRNDDQKGPVRADGSANTDPEQPRGRADAGNGDGVLRADRETKVDQRNLFDKRNQLDKRNQFDQGNQNALNSQNGEGAQHLRRNVDSQGNQKDTRGLGDQSNKYERTDHQIRNPSGGQLPPDGQLDDIIHPDDQQQRGRQLHGLDQTDHSSNRLQRQQRLGGTQQRLEGQRNEQNRRLQDRNDGNRLGNPRAPFAANGLYQEYRHYLSALRIDVGPLDPDPFAPTGERAYKADRPWDAVNGFSPLRVILPSDVKDYVKKRGENAGTPFVPFSTGPVKEPAAAPLDEFLELIQRHGQGNVMPKHALDRNHRSPAPPTPMVIREPASVLDQAFEAFRSRKMMPSIPAAVPSPMSVPARSIPSAPESVQPVGARSRLDSLASVSSASSRADSLRDQIIAGSRSSRGELSRQVRFDDAVELPRDDESITVDFTPRGLTPSAESPQSVLNRATPTPLEVARTSLPFTRSVSQLSVDSDDGIDADTFGQLIIKGSRVSRGELSRQQSDTELAAFRAKQWERFREKFGPGRDEPASGAASSISSSESSEADGVLEDFSEIESISDAADTAAEWQRTESHDSGNDSPTRFARANWEAQPVARVADLETAEPKSAHKVELARIVDLLRARKLREEAEREVASTQNEEASWDPQPVARVGTPIDPRAALMADLERVIQQRAAP
ncbi:hypothetical protein [Stenotrophomonas sp. AB1(2024)]|uniref:hypothetical protein n=1 Tax=Stenotrophomonas sp. AB1(2024) TaxID=3132215 RepID=UPI00309D6863